MKNMLRRNWRKPLLILLAVLLLHWLLIDPSEVKMESRRFSPPDCYSVGQGSLNAVQVYTPLFFGSANSWATDNSAADLEQISLSASGTMDIRLNFGLLTAPHKVKVTAWDVQDIDYSRDIDLWLKHSTPRDMPHSYTPGLLEIPLTRDDRMPCQLLVIEATWYGILGPKTGTYAVTVHGWRATA